MEEGRRGATGLVLLVVAAGRESPTRSAGEEVVGRRGRARGRGQGDRGAPLLCELWAPGGSRQRAQACAWDRGGGPTWTGGSWKASSWSSRGKRGGGRRERSRFGEGRWSRGKPAASGSSWQPWRSSMEVPCPKETSRGMSRGRGNQRGKGRRKGTDKDLAGRLRRRDPGGFGRFASVHAGACEQRQGRGRRGTTRQRPGGVGIDGGESGGEVEATIWVDGENEVDLAAGGGTGLMGQAP